MWHLDLDLNIPFQMPHLPVKMLQRINAAACPAMLYYTVSQSDIFAHPSSAINGRFGLFKAFPIISSSL